MRTRAEPLTADDVFDVVRSAVALVLEVAPDAVHRDTAFADLAADSLALVEVAEIVEEQLRGRGGPDFHLPDAELERLMTLGDAVDAAMARL